MKIVDIAIIGNGVLGMSTAFRLNELDPSASVALIGSDTYLNGATVAAGAMLGVYGEVTEATLKSKPALAKFEMALKSQGIWPDWVDRINNHLPCESKINIKYGTHIILNSQASKRETRNFDAVIHCLEKYQAAFEYCSPDHIPGINPVDTHRALRSMYVPGEGTINPIKLLNAFKEINQNEKMFDYVNSTVIKIEVVNDVNKKIVTADGQIIHAKNIVIAAGSYSSQLIKQLPQVNEHTPLVLSGVGCSLILKSPESKLETVVRTPNRAGACGAHYLPYDKNNGVVYLGASNSVRMDPQINPRLADTNYLMHWGMQQFDQSLYNSEILKINIGNRPITVDTFPLIGSTNVDGLWILTGTFRDGVQDSPLLADMIANEILFDKNILNHPFSPMRRPIQTLSKQEAIDEVVEHYISAGYEHGMDLPKIGWEFRLSNMMKTWVSDLYDELGTSYGIPPEVLMMLNQTKGALPDIKKYFKNLDAKSVTEKEAVLK